MVSFRVNWQLTFVLVVATSIETALLFAQEKPAKDATPRPAAHVSRRQSAEKTIRQALNKNVTLWYSSTPLSAVAEDLQTKLGVPVRLDAPALKEAGIEAGAEITFSIAKVSARSALFHLLRPLDLTAVIEHEALWITSPVEAERLVKTKVYDVADLLAAIGSDEESGDLTSLIDVVENCVDQKSWVENGGGGSIRGFQTAGIHALVVSQTEGGHDDLADLLAQLRAIRVARANRTVAAGQPTARSNGPNTQPLRASEARLGIKMGESETQIRAALEKPLKLKIDGLSLAETVQRIATAASVPIIISTKTVAECEDGRALVRLDAAGRSLRAVLDEVAHSRKLVWTYRGEALLVLPESEEASLLCTRVYDLSDLAAFRNGQGEGIPDYDRIMDTIAETINTGSWIDNGGEGTISPYDKAGIHGIVVSQTWKTHLEIENLLAKLSALGRPMTSEEIKKLPPRDRAETAAENMTPATVARDSRLDATIAANNRFALELLRKLDGDNRVFSPACLSTAMAMVYGGARGKTAEEMAKVMHFDAQAENVAQGHQLLLAALGSANHPGCTLTAANRIWGQRGYGFLEPFLTATRERFGSGLTEIDFAQPGQVCNLINTWAAEQTAGRIKQIVDPTFIKQDLRFIVTSAVYFKGDWADPFKKADTRTAPFYGDGGQAEVPLMHKEARCRYGSFGGVKVIEKPYRGGELAMLVALPRKEPSALGELGKSLTVEKLNDWAANLASQKVDLFLPKFQLDLATPLNGPLAALGLAEAFDPQRADLSGVNGHKEPLWLDQILQRAFINVDESGTEAAAVTVIGGLGGMMKDPEISVFRADHPFLFIIRDTRTGCILFMGRFAKP
jgi:serpin B